MNTLRDKADINVAFLSTTPSHLSAEFNTRLQTAGQDLAYFCNSYDPSIQKDGESGLLKTLLSGLFVDRSGVEKIYAKPFELSIFHSRAVDRLEIEEIINDSIKKFQMTQV